MRISPGSFSRASRTDQTAELTILILNHTRHSVPIPGWEKVGDEIAVKYMMLDIFLFIPHNWSDKNVRQAPGVSQL